MGIKTPPKHDHQPLIFPENFLWGAATSSHQVEGNNTLNDWWEWEQKNQPKEKCSGEACDQYNRFKSDFKLIKDLGHNAHRLSVEWSRIEPEEGKFDLEAIQHYQEVLKTLKGTGVKVMLTLHHFTNPLWFSKKGGWESFKAPFYFERFIKTIVPEIKDYVDFWVTINEPGVYVWNGCLVGIWPPAKKSKLSALLVNFNFVRAHKRAYKAIHNIIPDAKVGVAQNVQSYTAFHKHSLIEQLAVVFSDWTANHTFYSFTKGHHDFLGINYYLHHRLMAKDGSIIPEVTDVTNFTKEVSDMGWEIFPEGIFDVLTDLSDGIPIYITECGIATSNDDRRIRFLMQYLQEVYRAIQAGVKVKGFFYWSLMDNFEWADGFEPRFGLVDVDFKTQKRTPRPSALIYQDIIKNNGIRHDLMKFLGHRIHVDDVIEIPGVGEIKE